MSHSKLTDIRLSIVVVNNPVLNAFAVPGGVIGVHNGLLNYSQTEEELAAVLAHEIAHLELKHFARSQEQAKRRSLPTLLGILAGVLLAVAGDPDASFALLFSTQAAGIESRLRYSRDHELEADRAGARILYSAGLSPAAVPSMFERLLKDYRFRSRPPEFLLTHPITERRIAEGRSLARRLPRQASGKRLWKFDERFELMRARVQIKFAKNPQREVKIWQQKLAQSKQPATSTAYGYAIALANANRSSEAAEILDKLLNDNQHSLPLIYTRAEIALQQGKSADIVDLLSSSWKLYPGNYPLGYIYAQVLNASGNAVKASRILRQVLRSHNQEPALWTLLAESHGLSGNIVGVHEANAENLVLTGRLQEAQQRLRFALRLAFSDLPAVSRIRNRIVEIQRLHQEEKEL